MGPGVLCVCSINTHRRRGQGVPRVGTYGAVSGRVSMCVHTHSESTKRWKTIYTYVYPPHPNIHMPMCPKTKLKTRHTHSCWDERSQQSTQDTHIQTVSSGSTTADRLWSTQNFHRKTLYTHLSRQTQTAAMFEYTGWHNESVISSDNDEKIQQTKAINLQAPLCYWLVGLQTYMKCTRLLDLRLNKRSAILSICL